MPKKSINREYFKKPNRRQRKQEVGTNYIERGGGGRFIKYGLNIYVEKWQMSSTK